MPDERFDEDAPLLERGEAIPPEWFGDAGVRPGFREALLIQTSRRVRNRARFRRALIGGAVAAAYVLGLGTASWFRVHPHGSPPLRSNGVVTSPAREVTPRPETPDSPTLALLRDPEALARKLASLPATEQTRFLKRAGDRYLSDFNDIPLAMGCYRQMLSKLPAQLASKPEPGDTWLLTVLKQGRSEEVSHEKPQA